MRERSLWTVHMATSGVVLILLALHMAIMHLDATLGIFGTAEVSPVDWASVVERMKSIFFAVSYVILLGAALYHGFYGLRNILLELHPRAGLRTLINVGLSLVALALFVFGTWAALASPATAAMGG